MILQLKSANYTVLVNSFGAELCSVKNNNGLEFIWEANQSVWARHAPVLFPIVGKLKNNTFQYQQVNYELGQHGFARDLNFELTESTSSSCTFRLEANEKTRQHYPFEFILEIKYILINNQLEVIYVVRNSTSEKLYFSIGAHPAFNIPLEKDELFEDYFFEFSSTSLEQTKLEQGLISNSKKTIKLLNHQLGLSSGLFDEDALVFENTQIEEISLKSSKTGHKIELICTNWPFFGIWSKKGCKEFVCLEPWFGIADLHDSNQVFTEKKGIICLEPLKTFECGYTLGFE